MEFVKKNGWKITWVALGAIAFIGTLSFLNEVLVEAPAREARAERLVEEMREIERQADYDQCLSTAYDLYSANWDSQCVNIGKPVNCTLNAYQSEMPNNTYAADQKRCDLRYGK